MGNTFAIHTFPKADGTQQVNRSCFQRAGPNSAQYMAARPYVTFETNG
jgi:hypothetical protein